REVTAAAGNFNLSNPGAWIDSGPGGPGRGPDKTRGSVNIDAKEAARYFARDLEQPRHDHARHESPNQRPVDFRGAVAARDRRAIHAGGLAGHHALRRHPHDAARRHAGDRHLHADRRPAAVSAGARRRRQNHGCQHCHPGRHLGRHGDAGTLWSLDPVYAPERGRDQRSVRTIHFLPPSASLSLSGPFYDPTTSVDVTLTRTPFGAVAGLTANQRAVGNALEAGYSTTLTGPAATLYTNLLMTAISGKRCWDACARR